MIRCAKSPFSGWLIRLAIRSIRSNNDYKQTKDQKQKPNQFVKSRYWSLLPWSWIISLGDRLNCVRRSLYSWTSRPVVQYYLKQKRHKSFLRHKPLPSETCCSFPLLFHATWRIYGAKMFLIFLLHSWPLPSRKEFGPLFIHELPSLLTGFTNCLYVGFKVEKNKLSTFDCFPLTLYIPTIQSRLIY